MANEYSSLIRSWLVTLLVFSPFFPVYATVGLGDESQTGEQSNSPYTQLAHLELENGLFEKILNELTCFDADHALKNTFSPLLALGRPVSAVEIEQMCTTIKYGVLFLFKEIVPKHFWQQDLEMFYASKLTPEEAHSLAVLYPDSPVTLAMQQQLQQLRGAYSRKLLSDLPAEIRNMTQFSRIPSGGMEPSLLIGDQILVNKLAYKDRSPRRGDIVVFRFPEDESKTFVKRIIGLPKDTFEIRDKIVYLNNQVLREDDYVQHLDAKIIEKTLNPRDNIGPLVVPDDCYFVLGDNREGSLDSRFWGFLKRDKIIGKVSLIYWSWDDAAKTARWDRAGQRIK